MPDTEEKISVLINVPAGISNTTFHKRCTGKQGYWWLKKDGESFVNLGGFFRGDQPLKVTLDLLPGVYVLGCGPSGKHGHREKVEVYVGHQYV